VSSVFLIDTLENSEALRALGRMGHELIRTLGEDAGVGLLTVNSKFEYEIQYEWNDLRRWNITKLDGGTGIPEGI
jgi:hypothetical protein